MRCFLAFDFNEEDKNKIKQILKKLLKTKKFRILKEKGKLKVVQEKNFHITFLFFEYLNEELKEKIINKMKELDFQNLELEIRKINYFKSRENIRVIFLEVDNKIFQLINKYKEEFLDLGLDQERVKQLRELKPHITIIRLRKPIKEEAIKKEIEEINEFLNNKKIRITLDSFALFKSTLLRTGPIYEKIFEIR
ncbi:MAG TPA: RNA 2',3'-cyclic phosphodiesterase [Nautiliaceae bacterium]|nr:RNA 2',3'-cyclic phosphodiesterase [Nautiliaceae bacterium]